MVRRSSILDPAVLILLLAPHETLIHNSPCRNSIYWTLLLVFLAGTVEANLLYLGYLVFALIYLYSTNRIYKYRNAHWRYARIYNIIVIFAKVPSR